MLFLIFIYFIAFPMFCALYFQYSCLCVLFGFACFLFVFLMFPLFFFAGHGGVAPARHEPAVGAGAGEKQK